MLIPLLLLILLIALNVAIHFLSKVPCREEDILRIADGSLTMKSEAKHMPAAAWIITLMFIVLAVIQPIHTVHYMTFCICMACFCSLFLGIITFFARRKYYTINDEGLTCVKNRQIEWSHTWEEIDHARRRIISTGKTFFILYDITTKDGIKHRSLPSMLGRDIKEHVRLEKRIPRKLKWVFGVTLFVAIIILFCLTYLN